MAADATRAPPSLQELALQAVADSEFWRVQRRQLASLPEDSANDLLARLVQQRRISPPLLELFRFSATSVSLAGPGITSGWLSYLGEFSALRELSLQRCTKLRGGHLQHLAALSATLQRLDLSGCSGLGDDSAVHLVRLTALQSLNLAGTGLGAAAAGSVAELQQLTSLDMGDLPATDDCCRAVGSRLLQLRHLRLSGTAVGDEGMGDLEQLRHLTSLDLSFTEVHAPPVVTTLRHLSMARCSLDVADGSPQEAMWLQLGCILPQLEDLQLDGITAQPLHGDALLQRLVAGASGSLRRLSLHGASFSCDLSMLSAATALTWLDLSATQIADHHLADLALRPLAWLSLVQTRVGDAGVGQLLAAPLRHLYLSSTRVTDASWAALAQMQCLSDLALSGSGITGSGLPEGASLERLSLEGTGIDDRGCRRLASALPALTELVLGGAKAVGDSGFRALCSLPKLESLRIMGAAVSDPGLLSSLPRCPTLRHLTLASCWLCSEAGLQSAAAAAVQANGRLAEVVRDGASLPLPPIGAAPDRAQPSPAGSRATARMPSASRPTLSAHELQHDERLSYSTEELLELSDAAALLSNPATAAAVRQLRARLPADLRSPRTGGA